MPVGGYGPPHHTVSSASTPLSARALVVDVGGQQKALVLLDVMLVTPQLRDLIAKGFSVPVITLATHTHSGPGAYARNSATEWAALGSFSPAVEEALATAARTALTQALAALAPAHLETGHATTEGVTIARTGAAADTRFTRLLFAGEEGPVAQLLIVSAHPTLVEKNPPALSGDWPALLAADLEKDGYKADLEYANNDIPTQVQQINTMITKGAKVLIIASIDGGSLTDQLDAAAKAGIKVISYDRLLTGDKNVDYYVSFDNYKVGVYQAN